ncbi:MAG: prepilin-type N-terminal cleavage/methylation domain-containing protein [Rickettsiales bacterium]|jgi:prepilin-type N-terminal cleavage/methylation domain-containing protein|nr:prepilin-type N-terminal cleavage/methylation domain-containing protein [Rickettsiales bacterium]
MAGRLDQKSPHGFTLIELSIILVIIGLLIAGILVGRDLIEAAKVRKAISQAESFTSVLNVFRVKYNALPGDISSDNAYDLGFEPRSGERGSGDNNGLIENCSDTGFSPTVDYMGCETLLIWRDLSDAKLIANSFSMGADTTIVNLGTDQVRNYFPEVNAFENTFVMIQGKAEEVGFPGLEDIGNKNMIVFTGLSGSFADGRVNTHTTITPLQAHAIDRKTDDGLPLSGKIRSVTSGGGGLFNMVLPPNTCYFVNDMNEYPLAPPKNNLKLCKVFFMW